MKTDKEYPATHSMETSWFAIDAEGNVAIADFGDDGPVPSFVGYNQICFSEVIFTTMAGYEGKGIPCMNFTDEQIDKMLSYSKPTKEIEAYDKHYFFDGIIEIDGAYKQEIEQMILEDKEKEEHEFCRLSPDRLLYYSNCDFSEYPFVMRHVKNFYEFYIDGDNEIYFSPFYYYKQEWLNFPSVKQSTPTHPFESGQLPQSVVDKAVKLPIKFKDEKYIQFAKYFNFITWGENGCFHTKDDKYYFMMKDENNQVVFYGTECEKLDQCTSVIMPIRPPCIPRYMGQRGGRISVL